MSYLRGACGVIRREGENNENMHEKCAEGTCAQNSGGNGGIVVGVVD